MNLEELQLSIKEAIHEYKKEDPMTAETLARIEELEWVLEIINNL